MIPHGRQDAVHAWFNARSNRDLIKKYREEAERWIEHVGLQDDLNRNARDLSFGQQKLLSMARLFAWGFEFLLLDEPTAGLAPQEAQELMELMCGLARGSEDMTLVLIEHRLQRLG